MSELGTTHSRVELDKDVTGTDALAVTDMNRTHDAGLEWLNDLAATARNNLSRRDGDNVDRADTCPRQRCDEHGDDGDSNGAAGWRGGSFDNLERGRQKREFVISTVVALFRKGNNVSKGPHAVMPGADKGLHIDRRPVSVRRGSHPGLDDHDRC